MRKERVDNTMKIIYIRIRVVDNQKKRVENKKMIVDIDLKVVDNRMKIVDMCLDYGLKFALKLSDCLKCSQTIRLNMF